MSKLFVNRYCPKHDEDTLNEYTGNGWVCVECAKAEAEAEEGKTPFWKEWLELFVSILLVCTIISFLIYMGAKALRDADITAAILFMLVFASSGSYVSVRIDRIRKRNAN